MLCGNVLKRPTVRELVSQPIAKLQPVSDGTTRLPTDGEIYRNEVFLDNEIGSGEFGSVWIGRIVRQGQTLSCAIKVVKPGSGAASQSAFLKEIGIVAQLNCPNIVSLLGFLSKSEPALMCLEFMELGSLEAYLRSDTQFNSMRSRELINFSLDICTGLHYLHGRILAWTQYYPS